MEIIAIFSLLLFWFLIAGAVAVGVICWIRDVLEFAEIPREKFAAAGIDQTTARLVLVLLGVPGMLIWRLAGWRSRVLGSSPD